MTKEYSDYLAHHGVKGQKWGVRRYQNEDGTLTKEGLSQYKAAKAYKEASELNAKDAADKSLGFLARGVSARMVGGQSRKADELIKQAGFKSLKDMQEAYNKTMRPKWDADKKLLETKIKSIRKKHTSGKQYDKRGASYYKNGKPVAIVGFN